MTDDITDHVTRTDVDGVVTVTFHRHDKLNAITGRMLDVLRQAAEDLAERDDLRVLVITGEGRYFTSGLDITELQGDVGRGTDGVVRGSTMRRQYRAQAQHDFYDFLESIEKPIVLAAQGSCMGIGIELGASCDFRLAADTAVFALPEVPNLAVIPGSGGVSRLTRLVGPHWAKWLAMAGETVDAQTALTIGFVHAVYPAAEFAERTQAFAARLAGYPREALGLAKLAIDTAASTDRRGARDVDRLVQTMLFAGDEHRAKVDAFVNRRSRP